MNTKDFVDDIKKYLKEKVVSLDSNFRDLDTYTAYTYEHTPKAPEIDVYVVDDTDDTNSNSYEEGENITNISLYIYCYAEAMKLNNDTEKTNAVDVSTLLADRVKEAMLKNNLYNNNKNVISVEKVSYTGSTNVRDTVLYVAIYRYDIKVLNNYIKIYR